MQRLLAVLITLTFFIFGCVSTPVAASKPRFCPDKDVWILVPLKKNGKDMGRQPLFVPKGYYGATSGACPDRETTTKVPIRKRGKETGSATIKMPKGYLDNPEKVYDSKPSPDKKKYPKPKKKRRIPPADNIRTWHADMPESVD